MFPIKLTFVLLVCVAIIEKRLTNSQNGVSYSYGYSINEVQIGLLTQHWEERSGDLVRGQYSLLQPDGKVRIVEYHVNGNKGHRAVVTFRKLQDHEPLQGHLIYPKSFSKPVQLAKPVSYITKDLFVNKRTYPNYGF